ncbi:EAL and HDOD domain-containing protein [Candidatus Colwellia aromaticivorans]|uniref:EAL and HDOD domain-containing protein n=1 Tax=Candidatus Colwellia aromaticivorans TaxID=2267621 RepID=UPI000DF48031|nr:HDOD domain-containing protein [Candidatus Colwellia aromaticivorans]
MKVYTARQAILNRKENVVAYELLYRGGPENFFPQIDPHSATSKLIVRTHLNQGLSLITDNKPALINFPEESILNGLPLILPPKQVMIEILETVTPSDEVYQACRTLYHQGYHLALDDFLYKPEWSRFFKLVKLIKFDIQANSLSVVAPLVKKLKTRKNLKVLAEKIETKEEFLLAKKLGFHFFQGYYFCRPEISERKEIDSNPPILLSLMQECLKTQLNISSITSYFERDVALSFKLFKFINSGILPITQEITSIKKALIYLGETQTKKLILLLTAGILAENKPKELTRLAIVRARFCELIAEKATPELKEAGFMVGLFSLLDAMLDSPLEQIINNLSLPVEVVTALTSEKPSQLKYILSTVTYYEQGSWYNTKRNAEMANIDYEKLTDYYQNALVWANKYNDS